jgi:hypothetical protein
MRRTLAYLLLALTLFGTRSLSGVVLCVTAEGHGALEAAGAACCPPSGRAAGTLVDRCGEKCTDTPIVQSGVVPAARDAAGTPPLVAALDAVPRSAIVAAHIQRTTAPPASPPRRLRQTVQRL